MIITDAGYLKISTAQTFLKIIKLISLLVWKILHNKILRNETNLISKKNITKFGQSYMQILLVTLKILKQ